MAISVVWSTNSGLVAIMSGKLHRFLLAIATNCMGHVESMSGQKATFSSVPEDIKISTPPSDNGAEPLYHTLLTRSLSTLTRAARTTTDGVLQLLRTMVPGATP